VVDFERVQELVEYLVFGLLARDHVGVLGGVVHTLDVVKVDGATAVLVHDGESLHSDVGAESVHLANHSSQEFVVGDGAGLVAVVDGKETERVIFVQAHTEVMDTLHKLLVVESHAVVVISDSELSGKTLDTTSSSESKSFGHFFADLVVSHYLAASVQVLSGLLLLGCSAVTENVLLRLSRALSSTLGLSGGWSRLNLRLGLRIGGFLGSSITPRLFGDSRVIEVPGTGHHLSEVVVTVNAGRDVVVVLFELRSSHDTVRGLIVAHGVSSLKSLQEFLKDLLLSLSSLEDLGVLGSVVNSLDIPKLNVATTVLIHDVEGLADDLLALVVHGPTDSAEEFVIFHKVSAVVIEVVVDVSDFVFCES